MALSYIRTIWKNRIVGRPRTYNATTNLDGSRTDTPAPGRVVEAGTPILDTYLNNMEQGIVDLVNAVNGALETIESITSRLNDLNVQIGNNARSITRIQEVDENQSTNIAALADAHNALAQDVEDMETGVLNDAQSHMESRDNPHQVSATQLSGVLPVDHGGTGCTSAAQLISTFRLAPVSGMYDGNGMATRDINLGFQPQVVIYCDETSCFSDDVKGTCGGVIVRGYPQYVWQVGYGGGTGRDNSYKIAEITNTGFRLYSNNATGHTGRNPNRSGVRYFYIAW